MLCLFFSFLFLPESSSSSNRLSSVQCYLKLLPDWFTCSDQLLYISFPPSPFSLCARSCVPKLRINLSWLGLSLDGFSFHLYIIQIPRDSREFICLLIFLQSLSNCKLSVTRIHLLKSSFQTHMIKAS